MNHFWGFRTKRRRNSGLCLHIFSQGKDEVLASEDSADLAMVKLVDDRRTCLKVKQVLGFSIQAGIPVPSLLLSVNGRCDTIETLAD